MIGNGIGLSQKLRSHEMLTHNKYLLDGIGREGAEKVEEGRQKPGSCWPSPWQYAAQAAQGLGSQTKAYKTCWIICKLIKSGYQHQVHSSLAWRPSFKRGLAFRPWKCLAEAYCPFLVQVWRLGSANLFTVIYIVINSLWKFRCTSLPKVRQILHYKTMPLTAKEAPNW